MEEKYKFVDFRCIFPWQFSGKLNAAIEKLKIIIEADRGDNSMLYTTQPCEGFQIYKDCVVYGCTPFGRFSYRLFVYYVTDK